MLALPGVRKRADEGRRTSQRSDTGQRNADRKGLVFLLPSGRLEGGPPPPRCHGDRGPDPHGRDDEEDDGLSPINNKATLNRRSMVPRREGASLFFKLYEFEGNPLGEGGFGCVQKVRLKQSNTLRAVKVMSKSNLSSETAWMEEAKILTSLDHPHICRLFETYNGDDQVFLVMEYVNGKELFDYIHDAYAEGGTLDQNTVRIIMRQILSALQYCHHRAVVHMDLKPENIMIKAVRLVSEDTTGSSSSGGRDRDAKNPDDSVRGVQLSVKLIDFGLAKVLRDKDPSKRSAVAGTFDYLAPEARLGFPETASDIWSTGIVLHALLVGMLPPPEVREGTRSLDLTGPQYTELKESAKDLVATLLRIDAKDRATASQAQQCAWLTEQTRSETLTLAAEHVVDRRERMNKTMVGFLSFHQSTLLRKAVLTAMAMQAAGSSVEELKEQFMRADVDGNGVISKQELLGAINMTEEQATFTNDDIGLKNDVHKWFEKIFDSVDTDGSDGIDYTEWIAGAMELAKLQREEAMKTAFHAFDLDGSGTISQAEFARVLANTPEDIARCMPEFDANGDGVLCYDEFKAMIVNCPLPTEQPRVSTTASYPLPATHAPAQDAGRPGYLRALSACSAASTYVDATRVHEWWRIARGVFRPAKRNSR